MTDHTFDCCHLLTSRQKLRNTHRAAIFYLSGSSRLPAITVDIADGRVYLVSHEIFTDDGTIDFVVPEPVRISRESIIAHSNKTFGSIQEFLESWRDQLIERDREEAAFLDAASTDPNATDKFQNTLMIGFIREGDLKMVKHEVLRGADLERFASNGWTALSHAVASGELKIIKYFLKQGVDVNVRNDDEKTPLMIAAHYSKQKYMKVLLDTGADRMAVDAEGKNAADQLCGVRGTPKMKRLLTPLSKS